MAFLKPDKIISTPNGLTIKQKIIPDSMRATKDVASWCKKGTKMKPCARLNNGTGKPKGITVHNTGDIKVATGTNAAEQYTRATFKHPKADMPYTANCACCGKEIQMRRKDERKYCSHRCYIAARYKDSGGND